MFWVMLPVGEADSPDDDDGPAILVKVRGRREDVLGVDLRGERRVSDVKTERYQAGETICVFG